MWLHLWSILFGFSLIIFTSSNCPETNDVLCNSDNSCGNRQEFLIWQDKTVNCESGCRNIRLRQCGPKRGEVFCSKRNACNGDFSILSGKIHFWIKEDQAFQGILTCESGADCVWDATSGKNSRGATVRCLTGSTCVFQCDGNSKCYSPDSCCDDGACSGLFPCTTPTTSTSAEPTANPTQKPTRNPTSRPTTTTTLHPTSNPTSNPTKNPTPKPSTSPTTTTTNPTSNPTANPTLNPTSRPTSKPTKNPTNNPTKNPTSSPTTTTPTMIPTSQPTPKPTFQPTSNPTQNPSSSPTIRTTIPRRRDQTPQAASDPTVGQIGTTTTTIPTFSPTKTPTNNPTKNPTIKPTSNPTSNPTINPTSNPTSNPSYTTTISSTFGVASTSAQTTTLVGVEFRREPRSATSNAIFTSEIMFGAIGGGVLGVCACCILIYCGFKRARKWDDEPDFSKRKSSRLTGLPIVATPGRLGRSVSRSQGAKKLEAYLVQEESIIPESAAVPSDNFLVGIQNANEVQNVVMDDIFDDMEADMGRGQVTNGGRFSDGEVLEEGFDAGKRPSRQFMMGLQNANEVQNVVMDDIFDEMEDDMGRGQQTNGGRFSDGEVLEEGFAGKRQSQQFMMGLQNANEIQNVVMDDIFDEMEDDMGRGQVTGGSIDEAELHRQRTDEMAHPGETDGQVMYGEAQHYDEHANGVQAMDCWTPQDVHDFVLSIGKSPVWKVVAKKLMDSGVDGMVLQDLTKEQFIEAGVSSLHVNTLMRMIASRQAEGQEGV